jgi:hypothetical protein
MGDVQDLHYTGRVAWTSFNPSEFRDPAQWIKKNKNVACLAGIQTMFLDFLSSKLAYLPPPSVPDAFKLLPSFTYVLDEDGNAEQHLDREELLDMEYKDWKAYLMPLMIISSTGKTRVSLIWVTTKPEADPDSDSDSEEKKNPPKVLEIFSPWANESDEYEEHILEAVESVIKPALSEFIYGHQNAQFKTIPYKLPTTWVASNWWNHYFILARIFKGSAKATQRLFSDATVPEELVVARDKAIVALAELLVACVRSSQRSLYDRLFQPGARPEPLTRQLVTIDLHNVFVRCRIRQKSNWHVLKNAFPGIVAPKVEGGVGLTGFENLPAWPRKLPKEMERFAELPGAKMPIFYVY